MTIQQRPLIKKEIQIIVPAKPTPKCNDNYNPNKTLAGNVINQFMCTVQDFVTSISKFF